MMFHRLSRLRAAHLVTMVVVICFSSLFWSAQPGKADVAPDPWAPGNSIGPANPTQVRMVEEYVQIDLLEADEWKPAYYHMKQSGFFAQVQADFAMKNLGEAAEEMQVYFPLGTMFQTGSAGDASSYHDLSISDFSVWVDDQPVAVNQVAVPDEKWPEMKYISATFPVRFPVGREVKIRVSYLFACMRASSSYGMERVTYIFETGAGWNDTIGKAVLVVNLLDASSPESVVEMPEGGKVDGRSITWTWTNFEPTSGDNFSMVLANPFVWKQVQAYRQQVKDNPTDGLLWIELGKWYINLASGKMSIDYPYFARLGKQALQKAAQLSPYDREPHRQLYDFYYLQANKWEREQLTHAECELLASELNAYMERSTEWPDYDLQDMIEIYDEIRCPNKPALTARHGIFPTLTSTPVKTEVFRQLDGPVETATLLAFQQTLVVYEDIRSTRFAGLYPSKTPVASNTPRPTGTAMRTRTPTASPTQPPAPTQTEAATAVPQEQIPATPVPAKPVDDGLVFVGVFLVGGVMLSTAYLWQRFNKPRFPRSW